MANLSHVLELNRCPHCSIDNPNLTRFHAQTTVDHQGFNKRQWGIYVCSRCGGVVIASAASLNSLVNEVYPLSESVKEPIPSPARDYLQQALNSIHAPAGAVLLAASSVDAMLKVKGYTDGSLYKRIGEAASNHLITDDMAKWAHEVRLDANEQRHADEQFVLPTEQSAKKSVDFAMALAEFLFVLPSRVQRGLADTAQNP